MIKDPIPEVWDFAAEMQAGFYALWAGVVLKFALIVALVIGYARFYALWAGVVLKSERGGKARAARQRFYALWAGVVLKSTARSDGAVPRDVSMPFGRALF